MRADAQDRDVAMLMGIDPNHVYRVAVGLATALGLVRRGLRPLVLEQFEVGNHYGSSHGHTRIFRLLHQTESDVRDAVAALARPGA